MKDYLKDYGIVWKGEKNTEGQFQD